MGRPITVSVGPLASGSANQISTSQKAAGAQYLVLNGAAGTATANNICQSQSPGGAVNLTLNGTLVANSVANIGTMQRVYITSAADDSGRTFTVSGYGYSANGGPFAVVETITGANASTVSTSKTFQVITSIAISGASAGAVTVGTYGTATLDVARRVLFTSAGNDSARTVLISGSNWAGSPISETLALANATTAQSALDYLSVTSILTSGSIATTITVGTNGVASSPWVRFDDYFSGNQTTVATAVTGTVNYDVQTTMDDPNSASDPIADESVSWLASLDTAVVGATASKSSYFAYTPIFARVLLNSGSGSVRTTFRQADNG